MDRTLRLLEVVPYYEPAWAFGGPPRVMSDEGRELARRGHKVTVFTTDAFEEHRRLPSGRAQLGGVDIIRFPNVSNSAAFHRYRFQPRGMRRALRHVRVDVAHLSELRHELAVLTWRACARRDIPLVISAHGTLPLRGGWKSKVRAQYDRIFVTPMIRSAGGLIAQTRHEAELFERAGGDAGRTHIVPLGVGVPPTPADEGPAMPGVPDDARVVLFLGRIHPLKGVLRLIRGFEQVAHEHDDAVLVIAGRDDNGGEQQARQLTAALGLSDRVHFPGPIYGDRRFDAYRRADLFAITPTHFEETSLASVEAASVGTPLLVSAQAEVPYLADYDAGATIAADEDPGAALERLLSSDLTATGRNAQRMIEERHAWTVVGEQLEDLFASLR